MGESQEKPPVVFISYANEDSEMANRLYEDLKCAGADPWMARKDLTVGDKWKAVIMKTIRDSSHYFCVLLSSNSLSKKGFVQTEIKVALDTADRFSDSKKFILPVRLEDCEPTDERLRDIQYVDIFPPSSYKDGLHEILNSVGLVKIEMLIRDEDDSEITRGESKTVPLAVDNVDKSKHDDEENDKSKHDDDKKVFNLNNYWSPLQYTSNMYIDNGDGTITDNATKLMWQKSGSDSWLAYKTARSYINKLQHDKFAGYDDWRLPAVDELLSLVEDRKQTNDLYIDPIFDEEQSWCWTLERNSSGSTWYVDFVQGIVSWDKGLENFYLRGVRCA